MASRGTAALLVVLAGAAALAQRPAPAQAQATFRSEINYVEFPVQENLKLQTVLDRLNRYLADYAKQLPATIASEHYEQRAASGDRLVLESEFGIMRLSGPTGGWLGLRDVLSVNGRPVADREQRLQDLFASPSATGIQQARRIALENARFNLGPVQRTINDPAVVLELLDVRNARRMKFTRTGDDSVGGVHVWAIRYEERERPTIIRTPEGRDQPAKGMMWVDPVTGRIVQARVAIETEPARVGSVTRMGFTATIDVVFKEESRLGFWVPSEMREEYQGRDISPCSGQATYTNYRVFRVETKIISP